MSHRPRQLQNFLDRLGPRPNKTQISAICCLIVLSFAAGMVYSQTQADSVDAPVDTSKELDNPCYNNELNYTEVPPCNDTGSSDFSNDTVKNSVDKREEE